MSPGLSVDNGFVDAAPAAATLAVLVFVVVIVVLVNGLFDDVEVTIGDWLESLFDEFFNIFFVRLISNSCSFFHSSSRSRSLFFSLQQDKRMPVIRNATLCMHSAYTGDTAPGALSYRWRYEKG